MNTRPDWKKLYGYEPSTPRPQELVSVTRHTADLAASALKDRMAKEYYHNDAAACHELESELKMRTQNPNEQPITYEPILKDKQRDFHCRDFEKMPLELQDAIAKMVGRVIEAVENGWNPKAPKSGKYSCPRCGHPNKRHIDGKCPSPESGD